MSKLTETVIFFTFPSVCSYEFGEGCFVLTQNSKSTPKLPQMMVEMQIQQTT